MAKRPILGNDPFLRGAAPRLPPASAATLAASGANDEKPLEQEVTRAGSAASGAATAAAAVAPALDKKPTPSGSSRKGGAGSARRAPEQSTRAGDPGKDANSTAGRAAKRADDSVPPAKASRKGAGASKRAAASRTGASKKAPVAHPEAAVGEARRAERPIVLEGEVVEPDARASASLPTAAPRDPSPAVRAATPSASAATGTPAPARPKPPASPAPSRVTPEALIATVEGAVNRIFDSPMAGRAMEAIEAAPGIEKVLGAAGRAIDAARPAYELASRLLPPAIAAARSVAAAIVSGSASRAVASGAMGLAEALVRAARDPGLPPEVDAFGEDPGLSARAEPLLDFLHDRYFRVEATGTEHVPKGPSLLVCNHSGALPLDGPMIRTVLRRECRRPDARWLVEDAIFHAPFVGVLLNRLGAVRACPENAERLLAAGTPLAVFPEGVLGIGKLIGRRYQLQRFGRGGFVKIAMRSGVPIVPVAIVGAEEATPLLAKIPVGLESVPYLPVTPTFPLLGPLGLVPLPTKWKVSFLPPVDVSSHGARGAEDHALVARIAGEIRDALQSELDRQIEHRGSILGG